MYFNFIMNLISIFSVLNRNTSIFKYLQIIYNIPLYTAVFVTHTGKNSQNINIFILTTARPKTDDYCYANIQTTINFAAKSSSKTHVPVLISFVWNR